ncbi:MerC domain-containing protein [Arcticibacter tournemirensis]
MKLQKLTGRLDNAGMVASVLCAVHCSVVPSILTLLPLWGLEFLAEEWVEITMIGAALVIGILSLGVSFKKHHSRITPIALLLSGFLLIAMGHFSGHKVLEPVLIPAGGFTIALAHYINWRFTRCRMHQPLVHQNLLK